MKSKKSQSSIIVTVLLVLIGLVAVAAVSVFIMNAIKSSTQTAEMKMQASAISFSLESAKITDNGKVLLAKVRLGDGKADGAVRKARINIFNDAGQVQTFLTPESFSPVESKEYAILLSISNPTKVTVSPVVGNSGNEYTGEVMGSDTPKSASSAGSPGQTTFWTDNLVAYFSFDNNLINNVSGAAASFQNVLGPYTPLTPYVIGVRNSAVNFDTSYFVNIGNINSYKIATKTISFWANHSHLCPADSFVFGPGGGPPEASNYLIGFSGNCNTMHAGYNNKTLDNYATSYSNRFNSNTLNLKDGKWDMFTYVFDASPSSVNVSFYYDGAYIGSRVSGPHNEAYGADNFVIGAYSHATASGAFYGAVDEFRFYNKALSASDIQQLYNLR